MPPAVNTATDSQPAGEVERRAGRNLLTLAGYDVVIRIGWIFKTESVVMPAFLDLVAGAGWLRGCLLVVNRFGQSIPPAFYTRTLRSMPRKRRSLAFWTAAMAVPFLALAGVWSSYGSSPPEWMAWFFLAMYLLFSCAHGLNQISYSTLQGKLIPVRMRGRLLALSLPLGCGAAVVFAWWLMGDWLRLPDGGFTQIFGFTGLLFLLGAGLTFFVSEPTDDETQPAATETDRHADHPFFGAWHVLRHDANFRRLAAVVMLATVGTVLFPHYQALAREVFGLRGANLMIWVVVQNIAVGLFGLLLGWIVHHYGERLALRVTIFCGALAPLTALTLERLGQPTGGRWYWVVFIPIGMTPLMLKTMVGYTLEIAPPHAHPRYLSTLSLCLAVPFCFSPLVGWLVDLTGFAGVFAGGSLLIAAAGVLTFRLSEPRHDHAAVLDPPAADGRASSSIVY